MAATFLHSSFLSLNQILINSPHQVPSSTSPKLYLNSQEMSRQSHVSPSTSNQGPTPLLAKIIRDPAFSPLPSVVLNREARHRTSQEAHFWDAYEQSLRKDYSFAATINRYPRGILTVAPQPHKKTRVLVVFRKQLVVIIWL
jgi:hypothetical protein